MCLNNTKELELCNSRRRKKTPDPPHSHSEFTRNRNSCIGPEQDSTCLLSLGCTEEGQKKPCVCVYMCTRVCPQMYLYMRMSDCPQRCTVVGQRQQPRGAGKKIPIKKISSHLEGLRT